MERGYIQITEEEIGKPIVEVKIVNGTVWMFKHEIARLFDVYLQTVGNNFRSIFIDNRILVSLRSVDDFPCNSFFRQYSC